MNTMRDTDIEIGAVGTRVIEVPLKAPAAGMDMTVNPSG